MEALLFNTAGTAVYTLHIPNVLELEQQAKLHK